MEETEQTSSSTSSSTSTSPTTGNTEMTQQKKEIENDILLKCNSGGEFSVKIYYELIEAAKIWDKADLQKIFPNYNDLKFRDVRAKIEKAITEDATTEDATTEDATGGGSKLKTVKKGVMGVAGVVAAGVGTTAAVWTVGWTSLFAIPLVAAIAYRHLKPGDIDDFVNMYIGTELAPELQRFEALGQTRPKEGATDLGTPMLDFIKDVLTPYALNILTSSEFTTAISAATVDEEMKESKKDLEKIIFLKEAELKLQTILDPDKTKLVVNEKAVNTLKAEIDELDEKRIIDPDESDKKSNKKLDENIKKKKNKELELRASQTIITAEIAERKAKITEITEKYLKKELKGGAYEMENDKKNVEDVVKGLLGKTPVGFFESFEIIVMERNKIKKIINELQALEKKLESVSPKELTAFEHVVSKGRHPAIYAEFVRTFGPKEGEKMYNKVFSSSIKRTKGAEENLATLFDENRKSDLERVIADENTVTQMKLQELCQKYKQTAEKGEEKKKTEEEEQKAREAKLKELQTGSLAADKESEDVDISGVKESVTGLASSAFDKLSGLTDLMGKTDEDKTAESLLEKAGKDLNLTKVKKTEPESYEPKDYKPSDLTTITKQELDDLREAEETLRKQLEMDRVIMKQYKQNIENDISEHYEVLKLKEEQLLKKKDHVLQEQQKIVSYYLGVLQNRESILLEQENILEMKRKKELEEIDELRVSIQRGLVKELEKEKKYLLKHHGKQMKKQRSLLQEKLKDYKGDNLHLRKLLRKYQKDLPERGKRQKDKGSMTQKKKKDSKIHKSFVNTFVN